MTSSNHLRQRDRLLESIAERYLHVPAPKVRRRDCLEFHEVSVWALLEALRISYTAGYQQANADEREPPSTDMSAKGICPYCGEIERLEWLKESESVYCQGCGTSYVIIPID